MSINTSDQTDNNDLQNDTFENIILEDNITKSNMSLSPQILKKSDLISSGLIVAYEGMKSASARKYGENVLKHLAGNFLGSTVNTTGLPELLTQNLSPEEIATAGVYAADAGFRKGKKAYGVAMDAGKYLVAEKLAKMAVAQLFAGNNEVFSAPQESL